MRVNPEFALTLGVVRSGRGKGGPEYVALLSLSIGCYSMQIKPNVKLKGALIWRRQSERRPTAARRPVRRQRGLGPAARGQVGNHPYELELAPRAPTAPLHVPAAEHRESEAGLCEFGAAPREPEVV